MYLLNLFRRIVRYHVDKHELKKSGLFDANFYREQNPEISKSIKDLEKHYLILGWKKGISPNRYFDHKFYINMNKDIDASKINPFVHFLRYGWREGRDPSPHFSTAEYLRLNPDLEASGQNPLHHYVTEGIKTEKSLRVQKPTIGNHRNLDYATEVGDIRIAVHIHIYHQQNLTELFNQLNCLPCAADYYFSVTGDHNKKLADTLSNITTQGICKVKYVENRGMDVRPFLTFLKELTLDDYDLVLKLHNKKDNPDSGSAWRDLSYRSLLGTKTHAMNILMAFRYNSSLLMLGPKDLYKSAHRFMYQNALQVDRLIQLVSGRSLEESTDWGFFSGTMFWVRPKIFKNLVKHHKLFDDQFTSSSSNKDGTLAHAFERFFGYLPYLFSEGSVGTIDLPQNDGGQHEFKVVMDAQPSFIPTTRTLRAHSIQKTYNMPICGEDTDAIKANLSDPEPFLYSHAEHYHQILNNYSIGHKIHQEIPSDFPNTAIFSAHTRECNVINLHEHLDSRFTYILFAEGAQPALPHISFRSMPYEDIENPSRPVDFVKTHPHILLDGFDIAIWIDNMLVIRRDLDPYICEFLKLGQPIGGIFNSSRKSDYLQNIYAVAEKGPTAGSPNLQSEIYEGSGITYEDLDASPFLIFNLTHPLLASICDQWWGLLMRMRSSDRLASNPEMGGLENRRYLLLPQGCYIDRLPYKFMNSHEVDFINVNAYKTFIAKFTKNARKGPPADPRQKKNPSKEISVDVIIYVNNALDVIRCCLSALLTSRTNYQTIITVIYEGSDEATSGFLNELARNHAGVQLVCLRQQEGYAQAVNRGINKTAGTFIILLNCDCIVVDRWIDKLVDAAFENESIGIVGPLTNHAGPQSIPNHPLNCEPTSVVKHFADYTPDQMNDLCEGWSHKLTFPYVPMLQGFCMGFKRKVIESMGGFDEKYCSPGSGEDIEFCLRAANNGFLIRIALNTYVALAQVPNHSFHSDGLTQFEKSMDYFTNQTGYKIIKSVLRTVQNNHQIQLMRKEANQRYWETLEPRKILLFAHYNPTQRVHPHVRFTLRQIRPFVQKLIFISNTKISNESKYDIEKSVDQIYIRENKGYDFGAWRHAILEVGWNDLTNYDSLLLMNDTCFGPLYDMKEYFAEMDTTPVDFWGITNHRESIKKEYGKADILIHEHLQSYFLNFNKTVLQSEIFRKFWEMLPTFDDRSDVIQNCEIRLTKILMECGFSYSAIIDTRNDKHEKADSTVYPLSVLRRRIPFIKIKRVMDVNDTCSVIEWIEENTSYNIALIRNWIKEQSE